MLRERIKQLLRSLRPRARSAAAPPSDPPPKAPERRRLPSPRGMLSFRPGKATLGWWLVAAHVVIVLVVGGGISYSAIRMLHDLADEQGKARVQVASTMAREGMRRMAEDSLTAARELADRPTLQRLLTQSQAEALPPFLRRSCEAAGMDACAITNDKGVVAQSGPTLDWTALATASTEQGAMFMTLPPNVRPPVLGAQAPLGDGSPVRIYVARFLDARMAQSLSKQVGIDIRLIDYRSFTDDPVSAFTPLYSASLNDGRSAVLRIDSQHLYGSSVPVFASTGEAIALITALLPTATIDDSAGHLVRKLLVTALVLAALAVFAGVVLSELVAGPVKALTESAVRLGQGDFSTSIPPGGAAEVGALARTMEDMRRNLVELTGTLRRREAEAQAVLSGIVEGVYAVDRERRIRYLNPQAARLLGVVPEEAVGRFCGDVLRPNLEDGRRPCDFRCPILEARAHGSAKTVEQLCPQGEQRTTVITSSNSVDGLQVQVIRDETELEAVRRARDSVLANISHEFRTPLAAQLASIELLIEGIEEMQPGQRKELVLSLERGTLRLTRLIDNLLESVRIESGQLSIRRQSVELLEVIEDARALVGSLLTLRRQSLEVDVPEDLPLIEGDKPRLTQVFVNLLANANKFAPEDSVVRIGAHEQDGWVVTWVEDEGPGPAASESEVIFTRFKRGSEEEPEPGGLGLGLWIVKSIVDRHGGSVALERTPEDRTRFTLTLPVEVLEEDSQMPLEAEPSAQEASGTPEAPVASPAPDDAVDGR